jgi:hypothetical protein
VGTGIPAIDLWVAEGTEVGVGSNGPLVEPDRDAPDSWRSTSGDLDGPPGRAKLQTMSSRLALVSAMALLTACSATPTMSGEPASGRPDLSGAIGCPAVNLLAPDGSAVDLSGIWRSDDLGAYYIHQHQSCVAWLGFSDYPGRELGQDWANVFTGLIAASDFTISGTWSDVDYPNPRAIGKSAYEPLTGQILLQIQFDRNLHPVLTLPLSTGNYLCHVWIRDATLPPIVEIEGRLGGSGNEGCAWVESAGIRYVLLTGDRLGDAQGDWTLNSYEVELRDRKGQVGGKAGDSIRVRGRPFPVQYGGCAAAAGEGWAGLLVETMTPSP